MLREISRLDNAFYMPEIAFLMYESSRLLVFSSPQKPMGICTSCLMSRDQVEHLQFQPMVHLLLSCR